MITTNAFILRRYNIRDTDRIYTLYTERLGKVEAIATGVRKIKSKLAPHLEPFGIVRVTLVRGRLGWRLVNAERTTSYFDLCGQVDAFATLVTGLECVDVFTKVEMTEPRIFQLLTSLFNETRRLSLESATLTLEPFLYALFDALGYRPLPEFIQGSSFLHSEFFESHLPYPLRSRAFLIQIA